MYLYRKREMRLQVSAAVGVCAAVSGSLKVTRSLVVCWVTPSLSAISASLSSCSGTEPCVLYHSCFIYIQLPLFFIPYCNLSRATYILYIAVYYFITKLCCRKYMRNLRQNACTGSGSTTQSDALTCMGFVSEFVSERVTQSDPLTCYITLIINYQL